MPLSPLAPVTDHTSMLNRIAWFSSAAALVAVWLLRENAPWIDRYFREIDSVLDVGGRRVLPIPGGYLLPALVVGLISRVFRLHRWLSDWLGIRERFDVDVIIAHLAKQVGIDLSHVPDQVKVRHRHEIMRIAFYPFTSSKDASVDEDLVHQALDAWSWFWVGLEAAFIFAVASLGLVAVGALTAGLVVLSIVVAMASLGLPALRNQCKRFAIAQVRAICTDGARATRVCQAFACLQQVTIPRRRTARAA